MDAVVASPLAAWQSYYLITGPAAAALTGLRFVVIALLADSEDMHTTELSVAGAPYMAIVVRRVPPAGREPAAGAGPSETDPS